jgi:hypothetical protein
MLISVNNFQTGEQYETQKQVHHAIAERLLCAFHSLYGAFLYLSKELESFAT